VIWTESNAKPLKLYCRRSAWSTLDAVFLLNPDTWRSGTGGRGSGDGRAVGIFAQVNVPGCRSATKERERTFLEHSDTQSHFRTWLGCAGS
jgi:hypothetical protein